MSDDNSNFLQTVQLHERAWGNDNYTGKPDLAALLSAKIVVFWQLPKRERWEATIHEHMKEIEEELTSALLRLSISAPRRTPARIYAKQRRVCITGMKITFAYCDENQG